MSQTHSLLSANCLTARGALFAVALALSPAAHAARSTRSSRAPNPPAPAPVRFDPAHPNQPVRDFGRVMSAMSAREIHRIRGLLPPTSQINDIDRVSGSTMLQWALSDSSPQTLYLVNLLLENGARWDAPGAHGQLALQRAIEDGLVEVVRVALRTGADARQIDGYSAPPILKVCENGVPYTGRDDRWAPQFGRATIARMLLASGVDINQPWATARGEVTSVDRCEVNQQRIVQSFMLDHGARYALMVRNGTVQQSTQNAGAPVDPAVLAPLDPARPRRNFQQLFEAIASGRLDAVRAKLPARAEINDVDGWALTTPLAWTAGLPALSSASRQAVMELLVSNGADVNASGILGETALMEATRIIWPEGVQWLIAHGARATSADRDGFTALHRLCLRVGSQDSVEPAIETVPRIAIGRALRAAGASITAEAVQGAIRVTPAMTCADDFLVAPVREFLSRP